MTQKKSPKIGDIVQIATNQGYAYAQLTHRNKLLGYLLRILPGFHPEPLTEFATKVQSRELYQTFVFRDDLYESPVVMIVGHEDVPKDAQAFPIFRDGIRDPATKQVTDWWLWDGTTSQKIGKLDDQQKALSIRSIWNYKILVDRVGKGWMPADEC